MSYPNSVSEIDVSMTAEGFDQLSDLEQDFIMSIRHDSKVAKNQEIRGYGYYLDNCGDGPEYCRWCLQPDCGKRMK